MRFTFILMLCLTITSWGQTNDSNCRCYGYDSARAKPTKSFNLTNGKTIILCDAYVEDYKNESLFAGFNLQECGQDGVIGSWDALCRIKTILDTLIIEEMKSLPVGDNFIYELTVLRIKKLYFKSGQIQSEASFSKKIRKYNQQEITSVLREAGAKRGKWKLNDFDLMYKLFIAAISGDDTARSYLTDETNFEWIDGASTGEGYRDIVFMLNNWK
jgi:hypothetical protein